MMRSLSWLSLTAAFGMASMGLVGCVDETAIVVSVDGSAFQVPEQIDGLRFVITGSESGVMGDYTAALDGTWPQTLAIRRESATLQEDIQIQVLGLAGSTARVRRVIVSGFSDGRTVTEDVVLEAACLDVVCGDGIDCLAGMCTNTPPGDAGPDQGISDAGDGGADPDMRVGDAGPDMPMVDGGPDGMVDAGDDAPIIDAGDDAPMLDAGDDAPATGGGTLIISEYVEGSANNKALEFYNASDAPIDLNSCDFAVYRNCPASGMPGSPSLVMDTPTMLMPGDTFVICHTMATDIISLGVCDARNAGMNHSGNDGYAFRCGSGTKILVDTIGATTGCSTTAWQNTSYRRNAGVVTGDTNISDPFPGADWTEFGFDDFSNLGTR